MVPAQQMWQPARRLPAPPRGPRQRRSRLAGSEALKVRSGRRVPDVFYNGVVRVQLQAGGQEGLWHG